MQPPGPSLPAAVSCALGVMALAALAAPAAWAQSAAGRDATAASAVPQPSGVAGSAASAAGGPDARPLPADDGEETEPNDADGDALVLVPGRARTGLLDPAGDVDAYSFHLLAPHHVVLAVEASAEIGSEITLGWGASGNHLWRIATIGGAGEPHTARWEGLLEAGDYVLRLSALGPGTPEPYRLSLDLESRFDLPIDLEPNDAPWQASALPADGRLGGSLNGRDRDVFRLPAAPASLRVTARRLELPAIGITLARPAGATLERLGESFLYAPDEELSFPLPEGEDLVLILWSGDGGEYELELDPPPGGAPSAPAPVDALLELSPEPIAAFVPEAQKIRGRLRVQSGAATALALDTAGWTGNERWRFVGLPAQVRVPARGGVAVPVEIEVAPNAETDSVAVEIALTGDGFAPALARASVAAAIGAAAKEPRAAEALPPALRGGLNVAWAALGGATEGAAAALIDGVVDAAGYTLDRSAPPIIDLAGDAAVPVAGVVIYPPPGAPPAERLARFTVEASVDGGATFMPVLEARASPDAREQAFPFASPVLARAIRLVPLSAHGHAGPSARLAELKAVADPAFAFSGDGFDIASRELGGHVVRASGWDPRVALTGPGAAWPGRSIVRSTAGEDARPEWVVGFLNARAARIARLAWHPAAGAPADPAIGTVDVETSTAGPFGPWASLGRWNVSGASEGAPAEWTPPAPTWARAVRFRVVEPADGIVTLPERVEIVEAPGPSIVAEWGDASARSAYELALEPDRRELAAPAGGFASPPPLPLGALARGEVRRGEDEHWYALELPEGTRTLRARFADEVAPEVALALVDAAGNATELAPDGWRVNELVAPAGPGPWRLRVTQPPQSIVVSWDTSISTTPFVPHVMRMIRRLAPDLDPGSEEINLLPFGGDGPLLDAFSGDPAVVQAALGDYAGAHTSSDADGTLVAAAELLERRAGARAVVLVTDAIDTVERTEALWSALARTRMRVFALHLPIGDDPASASLLLDWSLFTGGFYTRFASQGDAEAVFRRVSGWLRRPARYAFTIMAEAAPPPTGKLRVRRRAEAGAETPTAAVAIVLDGSGSMLQRLDGVRRIEVARRALAALAEAGLPPRTALALRVFGQGAEGSCASELVLPLAPFDAAALTAAVDAVRPVDGARTPIAESLRLAAKDVASAAGPKLIVLVTDGEETCGGDPQAEIGRLRATGLDVRVSIVGFALDDDALKETFAGWATAGGGAFFDAADAGALDAALREAMLVPFEVLAADGRVVATGGVDGEAVTLPAGSYAVRLAGSGTAVPASVTAGATTSVEVDR